MIENLYKMYVPEDWNLSLACCRLPSLLSLHEPFSVDASKDNLKGHINHPLM